MTERSRFWDGSTTGDATEAPYDAATEFGRVMRATSFGSEITVNKGGVLMDATGFNDYNVTTPLANTARVQSGLGLNQGTWHESDANVDFNIPTPSVSTRVDRIVLRKSWAAQTVRLTRIAGTEGAGVPALTQSFGVTWDVPLWQVSIVITTGTITYTDERRGVGAGHANIVGGLTATGQSSFIGSGAGGTALTARGFTADSSTNAFVAQNSSPTNLFNVRDDGAVVVGLGPLIVSAGGFTLTAGVAALPISAGGPNQTMILSTNNGGGQNEIWTNTVGGNPGTSVIQFYAATGVAGVGAGSRQLALTVNGGGSVVAGPQVALANGATDGFLYVPNGGGAPTGVPTAYTGETAIRFNTADNKLYAYINGGWKASGAFA